MKQIGLIFLLIILSYIVKGEEQKNKFGSLHGSIDSQFGYFFKDLNAGILKPNQSFTTNNYLNVDYSISNFRFGLQYEAFAPPMPGFSYRLEGNKIMQGYAEYLGRKLQVRLGSFNEQFGNGLLFRSYEERGLGINNTLLGVNLRWNIRDIFHIKALAGIPREYLSYSDTQIYGMDGEFILSEILKSKSYFFTLGGGWLLRNDTSEQDEITTKYPTVIRNWAGRLNFNYGIFTLSGEYVTKSKSMIYNSTDLAYSVHAGSAVLINLNFDFIGMGIATEFRRLENMEFRLNNDIIADQVMLNYLPSLTKQHKYTLAALYPYMTQSKSEIGGQISLYKEFNKSLIGTSPLKLSINGSFYNGLKSSEDDKTDFFSLKGQKYYREIGVELEKKWSKSFKTIFNCIYQKEDQSLLKGGELGVLVDSKIIIADFMWKISKKHSLRSEFQHMWTDMNGDQGWILGLIEYGIAPNWMFYASDMTNYNSNNKSIHYYNAGASFSKGSFRTSLSYGRNRAGYSCVGGICRFMPDYTGFNCAITLTL